MANYLDETGLLKLWSKIKSYAAKQIDMNKAIVNISASGTTLTVTKADGTTKYVTAELVKGQMIYCCSNSEDQIYCCSMEGDKNGIHKENMGKRKHTA